MAQKVTIAQLGIDTTALLKSATETKGVLDSLKASQKQLTKDGKQSSAQFVKQEVTIKRLSASYNEQKNVLVALNTENQNFATVQKTVNNAVNQNITTLQGARNNNKELLKVRNQLNLSTKKGRAELTKINAKLDQNNKFIKENVSGYEKQKINIGNYSGALTGVFPQMNQFVHIMTQMKTALDLQKASMVASTTATTLSSKALRIFKIALISTGIGAIVVALGSLVAFLSSTQKGIDAVTKVTKPLQAIFQSLLGVAQVVGEALVNTFSNPKQAISDLWEAIKTNIVNRILGIGDIFKNLGSLIQATFQLDFETAKKSLADLGESVTQTITGVDNLPDKIRKGAEATAKFMDDAIQKGLKLRQIGIDIEQKEADLVLTRAETAKQIRALQLIANDRSISVQKNNDAAEKAIGLARSLATEEKNLVALKVEEETINQSLNDSGRKDLKKLNELKAQGIQADEKANAIELRFITAKTAFKKQAQADADKARKDREADAKLEADKFEEEKLQNAEWEANELERIADFDATKRELENQLRLEEAEVGEERDILASELAYENHLLELEDMQLKHDEKAELEMLLLDAHLKEVTDIKFKTKMKQIQDEAQLDKQELVIKQKQAGALLNIASQFSQMLIGFMGKNLSTQILGIVADTFMQVAKVKISTKAGQAMNLAMATASSALDPTALPRAKIRNTFLGASSKVAQAQIIATGAIKGIKTIATSGAFFRGGKVPTGRGGRISGQNIPTQHGGDNILATVKSGEVILNQEQQARAGGDAFFRSIGVPSFDSGGFVPQVVTQGVTRNAEDSNLLAGNIANNLNGIRYVAIVDEIQEGLEIKVDIEQNAKI